jgi:hypothetical protein
MAPVTEGLPGQLARLAPGPGSASRCLTLRAHLEASLVERATRHDIQPAIGAYDHHDYAYQVPIFLP